MPDDISFGEATYPYRQPLMAHTRRVYEIRSSCTLPERQIAWGRALLGRVLPMLVLLAACGPDRSELGLDRIEAWQTVERYKIDQRITTQRISQWIREPGNEDKSSEEAEAALGLELPNVLPAVDAALAIATANPVDDLGFMALRFAFYEIRSIDEPDRFEYEDAVYGLLKEHYINDLRVDRILLGLVRFGGDRGVDLVDEIVTHSSERLLRARGAFWSASERLMDVDDLNRSVEERAQVRAEVLRMAQLVAKEYSDVIVFREQLGEVAIQPILFALNNLSVGHEIPEAGAKRIGGDHELLSQYRGSVLLLDFWATWCVPCIASLPDIERLSQTLADLDFRVITISVDENIELVEEFMESRADLPYINWYVGSQSKLYDDWAIQGLPTYIVVDRDGTVRGRSFVLETLYEVILDATGADSETRSSFLDNMALS